MYTSKGLSSVQYVKTKMTLGLIVSNSRLINCLKITTAKTMYGQCSENVEFLRERERERERERASFMEKP